MKNIYLTVLLLSSLTGCGGSGTDSVSSAPQNSAPQNSIPVANSGIDQNVVTTSVVSLDASASSDSDGDTLSYSWSLITLPTNSSASLNNSSSAVPTFTTDLDGSYVAQLIVNDGTEDSVADTVTIIAETANSAPVANAGVDQNVSTGNVVTLDASSSNDADGDTLSYSWSLTTLPANSSASLNDTSSAVPEFTADLDGSYVAQLIANDGTDNSVADTVTIVAETANSAPVANAGIDQNVSTGNVVTLDASSSTDADGDTLSYSWSLITLPANSSASLNDTSSAVPEFTADLDGSYVAQLIANDGTDNSVADTVTIIAETANSAPVANAGVDQNVSTGNVVTLDASSSTDADGDTLSYSWSLITLPANSSASLNDTSSAVPEFTADLDGSYVAQLIANDGTDNSVADTVTIVAETANSAPVANTGVDQVQFDLSEVQLNATGDDADSDLLTFEWSFKSIPAGSFVYLDDTTSLTPTFTPDVYGDYVISLVANDGYETSSEDNIVISVKSEDEKGAYLAKNVSTFLGSAAVSSINGYIQPGSYFSFEVKNKNVQSLDWTEITTVDANGITVSSSTDPILLGGDGVLSANESKALQITLQTSHKSPLITKYYFTDSTNNTISFIVSHTLYE
jgi:beta-galactosidase GanA